MPPNSKIPDWPFSPANDQYNDLALNQGLSIILDDDDLRQTLIDQFKKQSELTFRQKRKRPIQPFPSIFHPDDEERSQPYSHVPPGQHRKNKTWLVAGYAEVKTILDDPEKFSNVPYAELGDRSFLLALDPIDRSTVSKEKHLYLLQRNYLSKLLAYPTEQQLSDLAVEAVRHAKLAGLTRNRFDLAEFAEQAAVRFCGLWFGFASTDHGLIQSSASASYRALVHLIMGKHFANEPTAIPQARIAMAKLSERAAELISEYRKVAWKPREVRGSLSHRVNRATWPEGVTPLDEWGLQEIGSPLLQQMATDMHDFSVSELAAMAAGLIAGTIGNVQASVCVAIHEIFKQQEHELKKLPTGSEKSQLAFKEAHICPENVHNSKLHARVGEILLKHPPVPYLPRRATAQVELGGQTIKAGDDIVLWLAAASQIAQAKYDEKNYGLNFGAPEAKISHATSDGTAIPPRSCTGKSAAHALTTAIVGEVLRLPSIAEVIDPFTGKPEGLTRRWGFSCESYPLTHKRAMHLAQQPLNVIMPVKTPIDFHSSALQQIIHVGAPRVEHVLKKSNHVHFAWFQLLEQGRYLALNTVYDGDFDAYIQDFALKIDDLFDLLFEHVDGAPQLPVAENPGSFVDVIRASNARSVNGYFFSASPSIEVSEINRAVQRFT